MKRRRTTFPLAALVFAFLATACQPASPQSMPGMTMPGAPAQGKPVPKARATAPGTKLKQPSPEGPTDSMRDMPGMTTAPPNPEPAKNQGGSITHDTLKLQEPETPQRQTGSSLPAPELLQAVIARKAMGLEEFLKLAERANPTLAQSRALVQEAAAEAKQAGLYPNPSVGYQGDQIRGGQYGGGEQGGYVQQTIVLGGKLGLRRDVGERERVAGEAGVEEQEARVRADVSSAFYEALTAQEAVVLRQKMVKLAEDAVETAHQLANVGQADAPDVLQAEVEAEQAKIEFVTAERTFLGRFSTLAALCGTPTLLPSPLEGKLQTPPALDTAAQIAAIVSASPSVKRLQRQVEVQQARMNAARREWIPDLNLKVGEQYNFEQLGGLPGKVVGPQSLAAAAIGLPLWNRNQGGIAVAQIALDRARGDVVREQLRLQAHAEAVAQQYLAVRYRADQYCAQVIPRAQRAYQLYLGKYATIAVAYPQVLVSQRTLFQIQMNYLEALRDEWMKALALENYLLGNSLEAPDTIPRAAAGSSRSFYAAPE